MDQLQLDSSNFLQPTKSHAFVTFNNQDSVVLSMYVYELGLLCLMHNNRIFAFKKAKATIAKNASSPVEQNLILNLLTTPKYRAMGAMYIIFRLLDNLSFLVIIIRTLMGDSVFFDTAPQLALLGAIGLEVFYDVMLYTHKYWFLTRLSLYIGLLLFGSYYGIVLWKNAFGEYKEDDFLLVLVVLTIRLCAFILEEIVDYVIDRELHDDLLILANGRYKRLSNRNDATIEIGSGVADEDSQLVIIREVPYVASSVVSRLKFKGFMYETRSRLASYLDITNYVEMSSDIEYKGSIFAWGPLSVFTEEVWSVKPFSRWPAWFLICVPCILTIILVSVILIVCFVASVIPVIVVSICCCTLRCRILRRKSVVGNFWKELTHF